jgi:hypothetical protein
MNVDILLTIAVASKKYLLIFVFILFTAEEAGLDKERRRKERRRERSGGINPIFTQNLRITFFSITLNCHRQR